MDRIQIYIFQKREKQKVWTNLNLKAKDFVIYDDGEDKYVAVVQKTYKDLDKEKEFKNRFKLIKNDKNDDNIDKDNDKIKNEEQDKNQDEYNDNKESLEILNKHDLDEYLKNQLNLGKKFEEILSIIKGNNLDLKLVDIESNYLNNKLRIYYTSENRVDFRECVKDLAKRFKTRIEMVQISDVEETMREGGFGKCGRKICCVSFLAKPVSASIKMAKNQDLSIIIDKLSGKCGKLMCCLQYENDVYTEKRDKLPKEGEIFRTEEGEGEVVYVDILSEIVKLKFIDENSDDVFFKRYKYNDLIKE